MRVMKKILCMILTIIIAASLFGCSNASAAGRIADVTIDIGEREMFSEDDRNEAVKLILNEIGGWESVQKVYNLRYAGDKASKEESGYLGHEEVMIFLSDLHSVKSSSKAGGFNADTDYTDWNWILGKNADGQWELLTWGY